MSKEDNEELNNISLHTKVCKSLNDLLEKICKKEKRKMSAVIRMLAEEAIENRSKIRGDK